MSDELVNGLGPMVGDVDSDFFQDRYRFRPNVAWLGASGCDFKPIVSFMP
jgi:hypothetical protein